MLRQERCAPVLTRTSVQRASGVRVTEKRRGLCDLLKPSRAPTQVPSRLSPCRPCVGLAPGSRAGGRAGTPGLRGPGEGGGWGRPRAAPGFGFPLSTYRPPVAPHPEAACGRWFGGNVPLPASWPPPACHAAAPTPLQLPASFLHALVHPTPLLPTPSPITLLPSPNTRRAGVLELAPPPHLGAPSSHGSLRSAGVERAHGRGCSHSGRGLISSSPTPTRAAQLC